jgi:hypothetical protein
MSIRPEGWHIAAGAPSWDSEAKTFSFLLCKRGHKGVLCILDMTVLEVLFSRAILLNPRLLKYLMPTGR